MESKIIIQQASQSETRIKSSTSPLPSAVNLGVGGTPGTSASVQRIVRTSTGTQIYLSGLTPNSSSIATNNVNKRHLSPNSQQSQPPAKIKLTYNSANSNVPIVQPKVEPGSSVVVGAGGSYAATKSPHKLPHAANHSSINSKTNNVRRFVLSPVKSTGKIAMIPLTTSGQIRPTSSTPSIVRSLSFGATTAVTPAASNRAQSVTLSPQKLIIKTQQDNTVVNSVTLCSLYFECNLAQH